MLKQLRGDWKRRVKQFVFQRDLTFQTLLISSKTPSTSNSFSFCYFTQKQSVVDNHMKPMMNDHMNNNSLCPQGQMRYIISLYTTVFKNPKKVSFSNHRNFRNLNFRAFYYQNSPLVFKLASLAML